MKSKLMKKVSAILGCLSLCALMVIPIIDNSYYINKISAVSENKPSDSVYSYFDNVEFNFSFKKDYCFDISSDNSIRNITRSPNFQGDFLGKLYKFSSQRIVVDSLDFDTFYHFDFIILDFVCSGFKIISYNNHNTLCFVSNNEYLPFYRIDNGFYYFSNLLFVCVSEYTDNNIDLLQFFSDSKDYDLGLPTFFTEYEYEDYLINQINFYSDSLFYLQNEYNVLEVSNQSLISTNQALESINTDLGSQVSSLSNQVLSLTRQINELESDISDLESINESLESINEDLELSNTDLSTQVSSLSSQVSSLSSQVSSLSSQVSSLTSEISDLEDENYILNDTINRLLSNGTLSFTFVEIETFCTFSYSLYISGNDFFISPTRITFKSSVLFNKFVGGQIVDSNYTPVVDLWSDTYVWDNLNPIFLNYNEINFGYVLTDDYDIVVDYLFYPYYFYDDLDISSLDDNAFYFGCGIPYYNDVDNEIDYQFFEFNNHYLYLNDHLLDEFISGENFYSSNINYGTVNQVFKSFNINNFSSLVVNGGVSDRYQDGYDYGYDLGYAQGSNSGYSLGYSDGYINGLDTDSTVGTIFSGILQVAMIPVNFFLAIFNFEILGVNISGLISALLTICITFIIFRTIFNGGGNSD